MKFCYNLVGNFDKSNWYKRVFFSFVAIEKADQKRYNFRY